jgi:hypothetical protein
LREELLEDGDEVSFVRMLEVGRFLSFIEAWSYLPCLFTGAILLLERGELAVEVDSYLVGYLAIRLQ